MNTEGEIKENYINLASILNYDDDAFDDSDDCLNILIVLNRPIIKEQYIQLRKSAKYVICADGAANQMYQTLGVENPDYIPHYIVGDFDSIIPEVNEVYKSLNVKLLIKNNEKTTDLDKCLYIALEKVSEISNNVYSPRSPSTLNRNKSNMGFTFQKKVSSIMILGASGGRFDHTISILSNVYKYSQSCYFDLSSIEIFMISKSSISVLLKPGFNIVKLNYENIKEGYSIIPILGDAKATIKEYTKDNLCFETNQVLNLYEGVFFRKKSKPNTVVIEYQSNKENDNENYNNNNILFLFSLTTKYHGNYHK